MGLPTLILASVLSFSNTRPAQLATEQTAFQEQEFHFETMHEQENIQEPIRSQYAISGSFTLGSMESSFNGYYHNIKSVFIGETIFGR